jgi:four helix bundle protein
MERFVGKSLVGEKSYKFAVKIVNEYKNLLIGKEFVISKQLLRSGTSIGANVSEANGAISKADFSNKMSLAYKEALETKYWLNLLKDTDYLKAETHNILHSEVDEIAKMLFGILKSTRINKE